MLENLQYLSIVIEAVIVIVCLMIAIKKKKVYGWFLALTFAIYVFYDFAKLKGLDISLDVLYASFFIATLSALIAIWKIYKKR